MRKLKFLNWLIPVAIGGGIYLILRYLWDNEVKGEVSILITALIFLMIFSFFAFRPDKFEDFILKVNLFGLPLYPKDKSKRLSGYRRIFLFVAVISVIVIIWVSLYLSLYYFIN